jgi:TolB protein
MRCLLACVALAAAVPVHAQWTNRYPKNAGYGHQVYLEGYELPFLSNGPVDAAASPDGRTLAFTSRGWLWTFDLETGAATRLTSGAGVDSRPAWSPDARRIAFVRDDSRTLSVVVRHVDTGVETEIDRGMALDPVFTPNGQGVIYANLTPGGDLDLYRYALATRERTRLTSEAGLELRPQVLPDGQRVVYLSKTRAGGDQVRLRALADGRESVLMSGSILSLTRPAVSPDGRHLAYAWPGANGWELRLSNIDRPGVSVLLDAQPRGRPIAPTWSSDGRHVFFSESDRQQQFTLFRLAAAGGARVRHSVTQWRWGVPTARVLIQTTLGGQSTAARLSVTDAAGHPLIPTSGMTRFDGQNGRAYFYSPGTIELEVPAGELEIRATRGFATPEKVARLTATPGAAITAPVSLASLWNAAANGWYSGDHHFHLNYGGQADLIPQDLMLPMRGEDLDVGTPMLANLHNRFENQDQWTWRSIGTPPFVAFAQEVRSHFLGHVGLLNTSELFWPWVWGPGYESYGRDDRPNAEPLREARQQGGLGLYVHPTTNPAPFTDAGLGAIPIGLVADAALGLVDLLEVVCLWSNSTGTTDIWYRLLNAGLPVMPSGGTDVMTDLHRTMAVGSTRVYVRPDGPFTYQSYLAALKAGRSFVSTGPLIDFRVGAGANAARPGDVLAARPAGRGAARGETEFTLTVASAVPVDSIAVMINGRAEWTAPFRSDSAFTRTFTGRVALPAGGWVGVRVVGPSVDRWPAMAYQVFAHTAPIWIGSKASTEPNARRSAAADLLRALANGEQRLGAGYGDTSIPNLRAHMTAAKAALELLTK